MPNINKNDVGVIALLPGMALLPSGGCFAGNVFAMWLIRANANKAKGSVDSCSEKCDDFLNGLDEVLGLSSLGGLDSDAGPAFTGFTVAVVSIFVGSCSFYHAYRYNQQLPLLLLYVAFMLPLSIATGYFDGLADKAVFQGETLDAKIDQCPPEIIDICERYYDDQHVVVKDDFSRILAGLVISGSAATFLYMLVKILRYYDEFNIRDQESYDADGDGGHHHHYNALLEGQRI